MRILVAEDDPAPTALTEPLERSQLAMRLNVAARLLALRTKVSELETR